MRFRSIAGLVAMVAAVLLATQWLAPTLFQALPPLLTHMLLPAVALAVVAALAALVADRRGGEPAIGQAAASAEAASWLDGAGRNSFSAAQEALDYEDPSWDRYLQPENLLRDSMRLAEELAAETIAGAYGVPSTPEGLLSYLSLFSTYWTDWLEEELWKSNSMTSDSLWNLGGGSDWGSGSSDFGGGSSFGGSDY